MSIVTQEDSTVKMFACTWVTNQDVVDCIWNVMAHAQKPDFISEKRTRPFELAGASVQSTTGNRGVRISGDNVGYTMFQGRVKSTGYPLHSPVSSSLPLPCITVCHHISTGLYHSPPTRSAVKNGWSCTYIPQYLFMAWCFIRERENFTFSWSNEIFMMLMLH